METSKTAPLSTSRLKWALEIVTASKNCHEEEPADNNENKSQPIIARDLSHSSCWDFLFSLDLTFLLALLCPLHTLNVECTHWSFSELEVTFKLMTPLSHQE